MGKYVYALLLVFICAACSMPQTKIYSLALKADAPAAMVKSDASLDVLVRSPRYLSQPYIAYRTSPYQLELVRYSKWDSPPSEMVRESFKNSLSAAGIFREVRASNYVPPSFYSLEIDLKRFERTDSGSDSYGEMSFDANLLSPEGKSLYRGSFTRKVRLGDRGFPALAEVLSGTLSEGVDETRGNIVRVLGTLK